ncbi:uncharacterized protein TRIVIDRAFT_39317 [Trichoderma virens Gv29-8]|uniref:Shugoshin C-terminal domain-containing protein n=1 Tax=Hypocrea virens (strain Gv29-8 / FGSC 10586) TaxID=413071 RepID=G9NB15_HYPVG|nr:uncharacterized protein TRIVIDRAFT_39317 [Trichoderma virens Gv29-8]EHK16025.1 hypothetical protein TRIVIDRAFT_39317 [Trichoderma virens Gv29-8]
MARLNEMPVPTETLETLRKKMLRQNRELAKTNNIRALRIRELENECACMLSENLELRSRILELEKQVEDSESRRIADHAMAIKAKLESQLTEWGSLIAELGLEPPAKRHSPMIKRRSKKTPSFSASRPSPSQRRLREIAKDVEELGFISENKSNSRRSMNPEQILALRSEADMESPELGPPPMSKYIEEDPVKIDSPTRSMPVESSKKSKGLEPPIALASSQSEEGEDHEELIAQKRDRVNKPQNNVVTAPSQPIKAGSKRKFGARDDSENSQPEKGTNENSISRMLVEKTEGRTVKDFAKMRKNSQLELSENVRKPLAAKSTNDDIHSPRKISKIKPSVVDEISTAKLNAARSKAAFDRQKPKAKNPSTAEIEAVPILTIEPRGTSDAMDSLAAPVRESALFSPVSPVADVSPEGPRGDTPPPTDISSNGKTSRLSRRNRTTISYTEPNLRAKMRRPTKELFDAVAGEGKYVRRASSYDLAMPESTKSKREAAVSDSSISTPEFDNNSTSPLAAKHLATDVLLGSVITERRKRSTSIAPKGLGIVSDSLMDVESSEGSRDASINLDSSGLAETDVYEFTSKSPPPGKEEIKEPKKRGRRRTTTSRHSTMNPDDDYEDSSLSTRERNIARRRSMMV